MKKTFLYAAGIYCSAICCCGMTGCQDGDEIRIFPGTPSVALVCTASGPNGITVTVTPSEHAERWEYALGRESDRAAFIDGTLAGINNVGDAQVREIEFGELTPGMAYTVFARAYGRTDKPGPVASLKASTHHDFSVETQYVTAVSAGFNITLEMDWYMFRYALGTAADRQAFTDGSIGGEKIVEKQKFTVNYFDLEPEREYVFFVQPFDRLGGAGPVFEMTAATLADGSCPEADFVVDYIDVYQGSYRIVPSRECGFMYTVIFPEGSYDQIISDSFSGDIMNFVMTFVKNGTLGFSGDKTLAFDFPIVDLMPSLPMECYTVTCDTQMEPAGLYRYTAQTPDYDDDAGEALCPITVTDITSSGATLILDANSSTLGVLYELLEADWWDEFITTADYYDGWLQQYYLYSGYWKYIVGGGRFTYTETQAKPATRYYATACPMNANGVLGWGETTFEEFTTLAAD